MTFSDQATALDARDVFTKLMIKVLDNERPPYEYGTVVSITPLTNTCSVLLTGDTNPVDVRYGAVRPQRTGQVVRVSGRIGDRFISDVVGGTALADSPTSAFGSPTLTLTAGYRQVSSYWTAITGAAKYEVQFADDNLFTVNLRSFVTTATELILQPLNGGTTIYARVRALTSDSQTGPWSVTQSATVLSFPLTPLSDGSPPASSPQPVISAGLGFLLAEWLALPGPDVNYYEVHVSTVSGFTPGAGTLVGETAGTFYFVKRQGSGAGNAPLAYGTTYYVRLIAKDRDGAAAVGAQGSGAPLQVQTGDVGRIATSEIGDGNPPASSPSLATGVTNGIGYLYLKWDHVANADALTYEVHVSTASGFTPSSNTLVGTTPSNFYFVRKQGPGGTPANGTLVYGTTYYVRLIAKDIDGQAAVGVEGSGTPVQTLTTDIGPNQITTGLIATGAITAASAIIADLAVETAKIQDGAITNLKVADAAISTAKIEDLAVGTAKIADAAIMTAKIGDLQVDNAKIADATITSAKIVSLTAAKITSGTITAQTITVGASGAIQSSDYVLDTAGWKIAAGIAEFNGATITGGTIRTAASGRRLIMSTGLANEINFYTGDGNETLHAWLSAGSVTPTMTLTAPVFNGQAQSLLQMRSASNAQGAGQVTITCGGGPFQISNASSVSLGSGDATAGGYVYAAGGGARLGEIYGNRGIYSGNQHCRVDAGGGWSTYLSVGGNVAFESNPNGYNYCYYQLAMQGASIYLKNAGDATHRVYHHGTDDGVRIESWSYSNLVSHAHDHMCEAGRYQATTRHVNVASNAWRASEAAAHYDHSDPRSKKDIVRLADRKKNGKPVRAKDEHLKRIKPIKFKWQEGVTKADDWEHIGFDADELPSEIVHESPMAPGGPLGDKSKMYSPGGMVALLWQIVNELDDELQELKLKIA